VDMYQADELRSPVSFAHWPDALESDPEVGQFRKSAYRRAIMGYLKHLKDAHLRASLASAKAYFDAEKEAGHDREEEREAVRWFFPCGEAGGNIQYPTWNVQC